MAKHKLTVADQAKGLRKCLQSKRTPKWLKPSIRNYLKRLEASQSKREAK